MTSCTIFIYLITSAARIKHVEIFSTVVMNIKCGYIVSQFIVYFIMSACCHHYYRTPNNGFVPSGTLNNLQIQPNNTVVNTYTNQIIPNVYGNASGIFLNRTIG